MEDFEIEDPLLASARQRYEVTQAQMLVAEQLSWPIALLVALFVWRDYSPWLAPLAFLGAMWLTQLPYKRPYKAAERAFTAEYERSLR